MRLPKDYAAPKQEETAVEYIWEQKGCVQQRREPIVRCRDCRAMRVKYGNTGIECWMNGEPFTVEPGGFCAWGVRKADA